MSEKQEIYLEICGILMPFMRNVKTHSWWRRLSYGAFYHELELLHNIHRLLVNPDFEEQDLHWLNSQALLFVRSKVNKTHRAHDVVVRLIFDLISLVPKELRERLDEAYRE